MKKIRLLIALAVATFIAPAAFTGCGTTPAAKATQAEKIIITTVNDGMSIFAEQVNAGKVSKATLDKVKFAYNQYLSAQLIAKAVIEQSIVNGDTSASQADIDAARLSVNNAESALITLLNQVIYR